jgi:hypothetical protein
VKPVLVRIVYRRSRIDPTKISGSYSLLAVMLLVAEILFAIWFYRAESSVERSIAGLIMAIFFVCLMLLVMIMNQTSDKERLRSIISCLKLKKDHFFVYFEVNIALLVVGSCVLIICIFELTKGKGFFAN